MASSYIQTLNTTCLTWGVNGLSNGWNSQEYEVASLCSSPVTNGQTNDPIDVLSSTYPPTNNPDNFFSTSWCGLSPNTTYGGYVNIKVIQSGRTNDWWAVGGYISATTASSVIIPIWTWSPTVVSGNIIPKFTNGGITYLAPLTAFNWNAFTTHVNVVRGLLGHSTYNYATAFYKTSFSAWRFNEAWNQINGMNPPLALPTKPVQGGLIKASDINGLMNSINSLA